MKAEQSEFTFCAPIRRSLVARFWIGVAACLASLAAAALAGLLMALYSLDGAVVLIIVGTLWFGLFFLSLPQQRRVARALDSRRPGVVLEGNVLSVPTTDDSTLRVRLDEPYELTYGWWEYVVKSTGGPVSKTRSVLTHATLTQGGLRLLLKAEDSVREANGAGWPKVTYTEAVGHAPVRLWASDLVSLVEIISGAAAVKREVNNTDL